MTVIGSAILDLIILRDDDNEPITGLTDGDFDTLEAYAVGAPGTTAAVTLTEIGGGEYRVSFDPSTVATWAFHYVYGDGTLFDFREDSRTYEVLASGAVEVSVTQPVAEGEPYLTVAAFKRIIGISDTTQDTAIERAIQAASRQIDAWTGRYFYQIGTEGEPATRYRTARSSDVVETGDVVSLATVSTDSAGAWTYLTAWDTADYYLDPVEPRGGFPYGELWRAYSGNLAFPLTRRGVRLTGIFGWPAVPDAIVNATAIQANRLYARGKSPFGIVGAPNEMGELTAITNRDPDVMALIAPYRVEAI